MVKSKRKPERKPENVVHFDKPAVSDLKELVFGKYKITIEGCMCTPGYAQKLLAMNHPFNRKLNTSGIAKIVDDIVSDRFQLNGSTIIIGRDKDGKEVTLDGQNRLTSVVQSGETVPLLIVRGIPEEAWTTIDGAKSRSQADVWRMETGCDPTHAQLMAAVVAMLFCYDGVTYRGSQESSKHSRSERHQRVKTFVGLDDYMAESNVTTRYRNLPVRSAVHAVEYLARQKDVTLAKEFFGKLDSGISLTAGDPIYELREFLIKKRTDKLAHYHLTAITINSIVRVWNHLRDPHGSKVPSHFGVSRKQGEGHKRSSGYIVASMK